MNILVGSVVERVVFSSTTTLIVWFGLTRTLVSVTLLRRWIRRFTMIISAWRLRTRSKFSGQEFEEIYKNIENSSASADSSKHEVVNARKNARIIQ